MGICISSNIILDNITNQFLDYNIIDKDYNIIIGIYYDTNISKKSKKSMLIYQGIYIGYNNNKISKIILGMIHHQYNNKIVELYFENNIKIIFIHENKNKIKMILYYETYKIEKYIVSDIIKQYKIIDNNSEYIDLIYNLL